MTSKYDERITTNEVTISVLDDDIYVSPRETYIIKDIKDNKQLYCFVFLTFIIFIIGIYVLYSVLL